MRVSAGDPLQIQASTWNRVLAMLEDWEANPRQSAIDDQPALAANCVTVRNESGIDLPRFAPIGLGLVLTGTEDSSREVQQERYLYRPVFRGELAGGAKHLGRFGILQQPLKQDEVGQACVAGLTYARLINLKGTSYDVYPSQNATSSLGLSPLFPGSAVLADDNIITAAASTDEDFDWSYIRLVRLNGPGLCMVKLSGNGQTSGELCYGSTVDSPSPYLATIGGFSSINDDSSWFGNWADYGDCNPVRSNAGDVLQDGYRWGYIAGRTVQEDGSVKVSVVLLSSHGGLSHDFRVLTGWACIPNPTTGDSEVEISDKLVHVRQGQIVCIED